VVSQFQRREECVVDQPADQSDAALHVLGEIETPVVGGACIQQRDMAGQRVFFEASRDGRPGPIHVDDARGESLGHLPRSLSSWLAVLLDRSQVRLAGYVPTRRSSHGSGDNRRLRIRIGVILTRPGRQIVEPRRPESKAEALHQLVLAAFEQVHRYTQADLVLELADGLRPLACSGLLPETRLLLALLPGVAREIRHVEAMHRQLQPDGNHRPSGSGAVQFTQVPQ